MTGHVFISYARADGREYATKIEIALQAAGFTTWRDTRNLDPHQDFTAEIEQGISEAEQVVVCLTPDIKRNDSFVRREIQYALVSKKRIIPLRFADVVPPIHIITLTWIDFFKLGWDQALADLRQRLESADDTYEVPATSHDPYREYLKALYDQIVAYLQQTVFALGSALIELRAESSPDAVSQRQALPLAFFGQAGIETPQNEHKQFASFHEAFEQYRGRVLLLGDPGAGKTTTLLALVRDTVAKRLEDPTLPLPIPSPIASWDAQKQTPLADWLASQIPLLNRDDLVGMIGDGKTLLALDGLDELGGEREDKDPRQQFLSLLPANNQVIVSCRVKDYGEISQKAALTGAIALHPLDDVQMRSYLNYQPDLWEALQADDDLHEVVRTPLLLSLFAYAFNELDEEAKKLHSFKVSDLRDKIFETYIRRRYEFEMRKRPLSYSLNEMIEFLGRAAYNTYYNSNWVQNTVNEVTGYEWSPRGKEILEQALLLHLIIRNEKNIYRFIHLLLCEHFAFGWALKVLGSIEALDREDAIITMEQIGGPQTVEVLIDVLQHDESSSNRSRVAETLGRIGDTRALEPLIGALSDVDRIVRGEAAHGLTWLSDPRAVGALAIALRDPDKDVRRSAREALVRIGTPGVESLITAFLDATLNDVDMLECANLAYALGSIRDSRAVEPLILALRHPSFFTRRGVAHALGMIGDTRASTPLMFAMRQEQDEVAYKYMAEAVAALKTGLRQSKRWWQFWRRP